MMTFLFGQANLALLEAYAGNHDLALEEAEKAYAIARGHSSASEGWGLYVLGEVLAESGSDPERALDCLDRAVALCRANRMRFMAGVALVTSVSLRARHRDPMEALRMFREVIDHWRLGGNWIQQWNTLRNLLELFGRLGADEPAAVLLAASESSQTAVPSFGPQGERLEELKEQLRKRLGETPFATASERGGAMSDEEAVAYAKAEIERALERDRAEA